MPANAMSLQWLMKFLKITRYKIKDTGGHWKPEVKLQKFLKAEAIRGNCSVVQEIKSIQRLK